MTARPLGGILLDVNIGHKFARLVRREYHGEQWQKVWRGLALPVLTLSALGLRDDTPDDLVWETCQQQGLVLLTCNRNRDGEHSLEAAIRLHNRPDSFPVFTVSDPSRFGADHAYDARLARDLIEYLVGIDQLRGTGRLFVPID